MKETYLTAEMEVAKFSASDVIVTSDAMELPDLPTVAPLPDNVWD